MVFAFDTPRSDRPLRMAQWVAAAGLLCHLALLLKDFHPGEMTAMALLFTAWVALPWGLIWGCGWLARERRLACWWALGLAALYLVSGTWAYVDTIYIHPDPQGALVFLFVPLLGVLLALVLMAGLWLTRPARRPIP